MFLFALMEGNFWRENMFTHNWFGFIAPEKSEEKYLKE